MLSLDVTSLTTPEPFTPHCMPQPAPRKPPPDRRIRVTYASGDAPADFSLTLDGGWPGAQPSPGEAGTSSLHVTVTDASGFAATAQLLGTIPLPASLYNPCWKTDWATYAYHLPPLTRAGMYALNVAGPTASSSWSMRVYSAGAALPTPHVGQHYLVLPAQGVHYVSASGATIPWSDIAMHIAKIERIDDNVVTLSVDGTNQTIAEHVGGSLLGLAALIDEPTERAMNAWYGGKRVWTRGGAGTTCALQPNTFAGFNQAHKPVIRVLHVYRVATPLMEMGIGTQMEAIGGSRETAFYTSDPLLVTLDVSGEPTVSGGFGGRPRAPGQATGGCGARYTYYADAWDLQRNLSTLSVQAEHPDWPAAMLAAIDKGQLTLGMTHEMVAWTIGFPAMYETPQILNTLSMWRYDDLAPFAYLVEFDRSGRVTSFGADGHLP